MGITNQKERIIMTTTRQTVWLDGPSTVRNDKYLAFWGDSPFSNFYRSTPAFEYAGQQFTNSEAAFMYGKALLFQDEHEAKNILANRDKPMMCKTAGRRIAGYVDAVWAAERYQVMLAVLTEKFKAPALRSYLVETGSLLIIEASPYDRIWGNGLWPNDPRNGDLASTWPGQNLLGLALMEVREKL